MDEEFSKSGGYLLRTRLQEGKLKHALPIFIYWSQVTDAGSMRSHSLLSLRVKAISAHAFVMAVRRALSRVSADAVRQSSRPLNAMHTRQRNFGGLKLE